MKDKVEYINKHPDFLYTQDIDSKYITRLESLFNN